VRNDVNFPLYVLMHALCAESQQLAALNTWDGRNSTEFDSNSCGIQHRIGKPHTKLACLDVGLHLDVMLYLRERLQGNGFDTK
jgi:hypothetical protein